MINKKVVVKFNSSKASKEYVLKELVEEFNIGPHEVLVKINSCGLSSVREKVIKQFCPSADDEYPVGREITGTVQLVGTDVCLCKVEDDITGVIPVNSTHSGCSNYCVLSEFDLVVKPDKVSHVDAACGIGDAIKAYTALLYQAKVASGETVVIARAAKGFGIISAQLAKYWGAKVIALGSTDEEVTFLKSMEPAPDRVIDLRNKRRDFVNVCLEETGGIGVDCFIDDGVQMYNDEFIDQLNTTTSESTLLKKHDILSTLSVGGRWVTSQHDLQVDPPDSELLMMKCASIHYLFEHSWTLSRGAQGRYLHLIKRIVDIISSSHVLILLSFLYSITQDILNDIMNKMAAGILRPTVHHTVLLDDCINSLNELDESTIGKIVVKI